MKKLTPVLLVERIETCLPFWCDRLGFVKQVEVPHGEGLGFVILNHGEVELMLQSRASVLDDLPPVAGDVSRSHLYIEVEDLGSIRTALAGIPQLFEERTTPYGTRELGVRDPVGNVVIFAQALQGGS